MIFIVVLLIASRVVFKSDQGYRILCEDEDGTLVDYGRGCVWISSYLEAIWVIALTIVVGMDSDRKPQSHVSKIVIIIAGIFGLLFSAVLITSVSKQLELSAAQGRQVKSSLRDKLERKLEHCSASLLAIQWQLVQLNKGACPPLPPRPARASLLACPHEIHGTVPARRACCAEEESFIKKVTALDDGELSPDGRSPNLQRANEDLDPVAAAAAATAWAAREDSSFKGRKNRVVPAMCEGARRCWDRRPSCEMLSMRRPSLPSDVSPRRRSSCPGGSPRDKRRSSCPNDVSPRDGHEVLHAAGESISPPPSPPSCPPDGVQQTCSAPPLRRSKTMEPERAGSRRGSKTSLGGQLMGGASAGDDGSVPPGNVLCQALATRKIGFRARSMSTDAIPFMQDPESEPNPGDRSQEGSYKKSKTPPGLKRTASSYLRGGAGMTWDLDNDNTPERHRRSNRRASDSDHDRLGYLRGVKRKALRDRAAQLRSELRSLLDKRAEADPDGEDVQMQTILQLREQHRWTNTLVNETHDMLKAFIAQKEMCASSAVSNWDPGAGRPGGGATTARSYREA